MSFLAPQDRTMLLDSLRPPDGYQLQTAIGTTYSLDLIAMMVAPVGFTFFDVDANEPDFLDRDPLEVLEAIRRHASQIVLFYEAGRIAVPRHYRPLLTYLEDRVIPARAPAPNRSFHPKVWFIRYVNEAGDVHYRMLCLSRNLTFDRCWDTVLVLDGPFRGDRRVGFGYNSRLTRFVAALPSMAVGSVAPGVLEQIKLVEGEIGRIEWDLEDLPFYEWEFWPLGFDKKKRWPFKERLQPVVVVSPFLSDGTLLDLADGKGDHILVSRRECLDKLSADTLAAYSQCYQMSDAVPGAEVEDPESLPSSEAPLRGLHAKLYVADDGWNAHVWAGSANATKSAFEGNVEFLVQLTGRKSDVGVASFLERIKGSTSFMDLLEPYQPPETPVGDSALEALEQEMDQLRMPIASAGWQISVSQGDDPQQWQPLVTTGQSLPSWADHISVSCRLASLADPSLRKLEPEAKVSESFDPVALESLTTFVVIEMEGDTGDARHVARFLVNATLIGAPANRRDRLLRHMLQDRKSVLRFLLLLLSDDGSVQTHAGNGKGGAWSGAFAGANDSDALLEPLLRALDRSPVRLAAISSLLTELGNSDEGKALIPEGLTELFDAVWAARDKVSR